MDNGKVVNSGRNDSPLIRLLAACGVSPAPTKLTTRDTPLQIGRSVPFYLAGPGEPASGTLPALSEGVPAQFSSPGFILATRNEKCSAWCQHFDVGWCRPGFGVALRVSAHYPGFLCSEAAGLVSVL